MRILVLGGTGFIGPHFVQTARERGHTVTVFNRGVTPYDFGASVERLVGDRNADLAALAGREWDATIDLACFSPASIRLLKRTLGSRAGLYVFVSTVGVYAPVGGSLDEDHPKRTTFSGDPDGVNAYGGSKYACELEAEEQFPGRVLAVRPSNITGPGNFRKDWIARFARGGQIPAPGEPGDPYQYTDARDLAVWSIEMVERGETGIFNTFGDSTWGEFLQGVATATDPTAEIVWMPADWLVEQHVRQVAFPTWYPFADRPAAGYAWFDYRLDGTRARQRGLRMRSLPESVADEVAALGPSGLAPDSSNGLDPDEERALIAAFRVRPPTTR